MNREVHVRVWERAEVKFLRATRQNAITPETPLMSASSSGCGHAVLRGYVREVPQADMCSAAKFPTPLQCGPD
jgi:hypothetical protein